MQRLFSRSRRQGRRGRAFIAAWVVASVAVVGAASAAVGGFGFDPFGNNEVGQTVNNAILLPTNQWISPFGSRAYTDTDARMVSSTISPDGTYLAALGWNDFSANLTIVNLKTDQKVQESWLATGSWYGGYDQDTTVAPDGPLYSPDGSTLWVPQSAFLLRYSVNPADGTATQTAAIPLCGASDGIADTSCDPYNGPTNPSGDYLPSGMALSQDGKYLYVALNGTNALGVIDTSTNSLVGEIPVGNAPRQVVIDGDTAYVSNEGGHPATPGDFTNMSDGTPIVSSDVTGAASTGTVSVVQLTPGGSTPGHETQEIPVGLQPTALYQDGPALFVANSNDDSFSVIDTTTNRVTQTVDTNPVPGTNVGSYANAITMPNSKHVLVSVGRDDAIAVYHYGGLYRPLRFEGLIPTDWYPVQVEPDPALGEIVVTNDKGIGAQGPESTINKGYGTSPATGHNTYDDTGSLTEFAMPSRQQLVDLTRTVFTDNAWDRIPLVDNGPLDSVPAVIPRHLGGSSPIKHIVVIIKENRTYDQVLGDLGEGNGDPADAQFGASITPNQHTLAWRFGDLDNFYDEGTLSADGHNWIVQAEANDYVEKEFGAFYRSYPSQGGDALAYQRDGFLWDAAERAGLSVQDFGEYAHNPYNLPSTAGTWDQYYQASQRLEAGDPWSSLPANTQPGSSWGYTNSDIPSLEKILDPDFPNFQLGIPDQYRVDTWLPVFQQQEQTGKLPNLTFMWLMTDHTTGSGDPDPIAQVADNDLAVGRVVDTISHSRFWKSTAIIVMEDDSQNGVDHVDGHRSPTLVISPYSRPGVDDEYYSQINAVRTIEQILGIHPMNQEDEAATPMYDAFKETPNYAPYGVEPAQVPLTLGAPGYPSTLPSTSTESPAIRLATAPVPAAERPVQQAWTAWLAVQAREGAFDGPDRVKPVLLNRYDWYTAHGWRIAYPGDSQIYPPNEVPGRNLPAALLGDS